MPATWELLTSVHVSSFKLLVVVGETLNLDSEDQGSVSSLALVHFETVNKPVALFYTGEKMEAKGTPFFLFGGPYPHIQASL